MRKEVAALVSAIWTPLTIADEVAFQGACVKVAAAFLKCRQNGDIAGANDWMECLLAARQYTAEPFSSIYHYHLDLVVVATAEWLASQHKFAEALEFAADALQASEERDRRRQARGLPSSAAVVETHWRLLGVIADAKWRLTEEHRDVVLTPVQHVQTWLRHAEIAQGRMAPPDLGLRVTPSRDVLDEQRRTTESLLWSGLWTASCAWRFCRAELLALVRVFNLLHRRMYKSAGLALAEGHWHTEAPLAPESPFYWRFEIVKQWLGRQMRIASGEPPVVPFSVKEVEELYSQLLFSLELKHAGRLDKPLEESLELDYNWMLGQLRAEPEGSGG